MRRLTFLMHKLFSNPTADRQPDRFIPPLFPKNKTLNFLLVSLIPALRDASLPTLGVAACLLLATGCAREADEVSVSTAQAVASADAVASDLIAAPPLTAGSWTLESSTVAMPQPIIPSSQHKALPNVLLAGGPIVTSNNPESFTSTGWLAQHTYVHPTRGGNNTWLSGTFGVYVSHYNKTGVSVYLQVIAQNPHLDRSINVSYRSAITSSSEAGDANGVRGRSNYYVASEKALNFANTVVTTKTIPAGGAVLLSLKAMSNGGSVDGAMLVTADAPGIFTYVVAAPDQYIESGLALAHASATRRPATGNIKSPSASTFGTEAGVYAFSKITADVPVPLPSAKGYLALGVNYGSYGPIVDSPFIQTSPAGQNGSGQTLRLSDSGYRTNGNYGHEYTISLRLSNPLSRPRRVRAWFAANTNTSGRGLTYNGAMQVNGISALKVLTYDAVPKQELTVVSATDLASAPLTVGANTSTTLQLRFFVPGLASAGSHIILQTQD